MDAASSIQFEIISASGGTVDLGTFVLKSNLITKGDVWRYTVEPLNYGVG